MTTTKKKPTKKLTSAHSAGARYERAAILTFLRRRLQDAAETVHRWGDDGRRSREVEAIIAWVRERQKRYRARPGGL